MTPLLKKAEYRARPLFDPAPGSAHILDLIHRDTHYTSRTSDHVTGMLVVASFLGYITKVQACWFQVPFTVGVNLRKSLYEHEGSPFLGPDGLAFSWSDRAFGGAGGVAAGAYNLGNMKNAPNFQKWVNDTLFRGTTLEDSDFHRGNLDTPRRNKSGTIITGGRPFSPGSESSLTDTPSLVTSQAGSESSSRKRAGRPLAAGAHKRHSSLNSVSSAPGKHTPFPAD